MKIYGRALASQWGVDAKHVLYRKTGDWYHQLERFPGALMDAHGYVVFETENSFRTCPFLRIRQDVSVPDGIENIPGYMRVIAGGKILPVHPREGLTHGSAGILFEGAPLEVTATRYERDPVARAECLKHHGYSCAVCGMDFERKYGALGKGFIHVHHLDQLASGGERRINPTVDLRPVCPNCHAMLHRQAPPLSILELQRMIRD